MASAMVEHLAFQMVARMVVPTDVQMEFGMAA